MDRDQKHIFVTGGTGYLGRPLITELVKKGHKVRALSRAASERKLPAGCDVVFGNALDASSYENQIRPADTFVQLVGVAHPSPAKSAEFRSIDFISASGAISAAANAGVRHFVYLSVAHPAPIMKVYTEVRAECEALIHQSGMNATILRPWYILGPGHRWPYALLPMYWLAERIPATRVAAQRLGLVTLDQMQRALLEAIENAHKGIRIVEVPEIRHPETHSVAVHHS
jgi:uncharacterized protein YbjT (DUF2867 family)